MRKSANANAEKIISTKGYGIQETLHLISVMYVV